MFEALKKVLDDVKKATGQELSGPSSLSHLVLESSTSMSETTTFDFFCCKLPATTNTSLTFVGKVRPQLAREHAFRTFHQLRSLKLPIYGKRCHMNSNYHLLTLYTCKQSICNSSKSY